MCGRVCDTLLILLSIHVSSLLGASMERSELQEIMPKYRDKFGCVSLYPYPKENGELFDNENRNLFTGEALLLLRLNDMYHMDIDLISAVQRNYLGEGIFSRSPKGMESAHRVSHDEYTGLAILLGILKNKSRDPINSVIASNMLDSIVSHGKTHNWMFSDHNPELGKSIKDFSKIANLGAWRVPSDQFFIKTMAGMYTSWFEEINFIGAAYLAANRPIDQYSGRVMMWSRLKTLEYIGIDSPTIKTARNIFTKRSIALYGNDYVHIIFRYFKDESHPFHKLIR